MRVGSLEIEIMAGIARLQKDMNDAQRIVGGSMANVERSVASAKRAMQTLGVGLPLAAIADQVRRMTDQYTKLDAQLRLSTQTQAQYAQGMSDIRRISSIAQSDISATSMLYTRLMNVMQGTGVEQSKLATVTETVSFGLKAYGATAQEASSAALQLSQAMGANRLGGEEFRAVMEAMPNVMKVLADSMGVPLGALRQLSIDGKITADEMVKAFGDPAIAAKFKALAENAQTVTGAWIVARNELTLLVGEFMKSSGATGAVIAMFNGMGAAIRFLADNLGVLLNALYAYITVMAGKLIVGLVQARMAQMALNAAHGEALIVNLAIARSEAANALAARDTVAARAWQTGITNGLVAANARLTASATEVAAAEKLQAASSIGIAGTIKSAVGKAGWIGLALFGVWSVVDFLNGMQSVADGAKKTAADMAGLGLVQLQLLRNAQALDLYQMKNAMFGQERYRVEIRDGEVRLKMLDDQITAVAALQNAEKNKTTIAQVGTHDEIVMQGRMIELAKQFTDNKVTEAEYLKRVNDELYGAEIKSVKAAGNAHTSKMQQALVALEAEAAAEEGKLSRVQKVSLEWQALKKKEQTISQYGVFVLAVQEAAELDEADRKAELNKQLATGQVAYEEYWTSVATSTEKLVEHAKQQEFENTLIGKTKEEIVALTALRENETIKKMEETLVTMKKNDATAQEIADYEALIAAKKRVQAADTDKTAIEAQNAARAEQVAAEKKRWEMIDGFAQTAFNNIFDKGKNVFAEIGNAIKKYVLDLLYKMTVQEWLINIGVAGGGMGAAGSAMAGGIGGGGTGILGAIGSSIAGFGASVATGFGLTAEAATTAASAYSAAGMGATSLGLQLGNLAAAIPGWGWAIAGGLALLSAFGGNKGTPGTNVGAASTTFSPTGAITGQGSWAGLSPATNQAGVQNFVNTMNISYRAAAQSLGITAASTIFSLSQNLGKDSKAPQFAIRGGAAGGAEFFSGWTPQSDAAMQLAASKAVLSALQGSELPGYLQKVFSGLKIATMTQTDIDNTLAFAVALKQMRTNLTETRSPLEVMTATMNAGFAQLNTSAATFSTDFVAAIDAGLTPEQFQSWVTLGGVIDNVAQSTRDLAAAMKSADEAIASSLDKLLGVNTFSQAQAVSEQAAALAKVTELFPTITTFDQVMKLATGDMSTLTLAQKQAIATYLGLTVTVRSFDTTIQTSTKTVELNSRMMDHLAKRAASFGERLDAIGQGPGQKLTTTYADELVKKALDKVSGAYGDTGSFEQLNAQRKALEEMIAAKELVLIEQRKKEALGGTWTGTGTVKALLDQIAAAQKSLADIQKLSGFEKQAPGHGKELLDLENWYKDQQKALKNNHELLAVLDQTYANKRAEILQQSIDKIRTDKLALLAQIYELTGNAAGAAAILEEQRRIQIQEMIKSGSSEEIIQLTQRLWELQDKAKKAAEAAQLLNDKLSLQAQIAELTGNKYLASSILAQQRAIDLAKLDPSLRGLQQTLWRLQDASKIIGEMNTTLAQMDAVKAFSRGITDTINAIKAEQGNFAAGIQTAIEREAEARRKLADATGIDNQLAAAGELKDAIMTRYAAEKAEIERIKGLINAFKSAISSVEASIHTIQAQIKGYDDVAYTVGKVTEAQVKLASAIKPEDQIAAAGALEKAINDRYSAEMAALQKRRDAENKAGQDAVDAANKLGQTAVDNFNLMNQSFKGFADYAKSLLIGDKSALNTQSKLVETQAQYKSLLEKTRAGDMDAAGKLQGVADVLLQQQRGSATSALDYARSFAKVQGDFAAIGARAAEDKTFTPQVYAENTAKWEAETLAIQDRAINELQELQKRMKEWQKALQATLPSLEALQQKTLDELTKLNTLTVGWQAALTAQLTAQSAAFNALGLTAQQIAGLLTGLDTRIAAAIASGLPKTGGELPPQLLPILTGGELPPQLLPGFAVGINEVPFDMNARIHAGEEITPKPYVDKERAARDETNALLARLLESNNEAKAELKAAKAELTAIKKSSEKIWQIEDKHDIEGTPPVRA